MKKLLALLLAIFCTLTFVACGGGGSTPSGDGTLYNVPGENKTTIKFRNVGGGYGHAWIDAAAEDFAKLNAETEFSTGKKGVYIDIVNDMNFDVNAIDNSTVDCFLGGGTKAAEISSKLYDLTSIVTDTSRVGGSIESNLVDGNKAKVQVDGAWKAIPFSEYYGGLSYNYNVFDKARAFYASDDETDVDGVLSKFSTEDYIYFTGASGKKSAGPDGQVGTIDDGLPTTLAQFLDVMQRLKDAGYAPVALSGKYTNYSVYFASGLWASLAGADRMRNYYNSSGEIEIVELEGNGTVLEESENLFPGVSYIKKPKTKTITLDDTNGYLGQQMVEKFYTYAVLEIMKEEGYWSNVVNDSNSDHYATQYEFLKGNAAMLVEATYWYNESRDANNIAKLEFEGTAEKDLDVRVMNLPSSINEGTGKVTSFIDIADSSYMVNEKVKGSDKEKAVIEFTKFLYSDEQIRNYTVITGMARATKNYSLPEPDANGEIKITSGGKEYTMSKFYKHLWDSRKTDGSNIIYLSGSSNGFKKNVLNMKLDLAATAYKETLGAHANPFESIKNGKARTYFEKTVLNSGAWVQ